MRTIRIKFRISQIITEKAIGTETSMACVGVCPTGARSENPEDDKRLPPQETSDALVLGHRFQYYIMGCFRYEKGNRGAREEPPDN